jgi:sarcosine oxidase subunit gamma
MSDALLKLEILPSIGHLNLRGDPDDQPFLDAVESVTGSPLPLAPNTVVYGDQHTCWLGPDEWLLVLPADNVDSTMLALGQALQGQHASSNDLSGAQLTLRLTGEKGREILAKGCTLDLHSSVFRAGSCAQTGLAKANVLIVSHETGSGIDLIVRRSFSDYLLQWLQRAGTEYGIEFT